jgi:hypothetical protein
MRLALQILRPPVTSASVARRGETFLTSLLGSPRSAVVHGEGIAESGGVWAIGRHIAWGRGIDAMHGWFI